MVSAQSARVSRDQPRQGVPVDVGPFVRVGSKQISNPFSFHQSRKCIFIKLSDGRVSLPRLVCSPSSSRISKYCCMDQQDG